MKQKHKKKRKIFFLNKYSILCIFVLLILLFNIGGYIYRQPLEILALLPLGQPKSPAETWKSYSQDFKNFAFGGLSSSYIAALTQIESSGNPLARPPWSFSFRLHPFQIFAPLSSSFGLLQLTRETARRASKLCRYKQRVIHNSQCPKTWFYSRAIASHSFDLATKNIVYHLRKILGASYQLKYSRQKIHQVASIIHLCGKTKARRFVRRGFSFHAIGSCGSHSPRRYVNKVSRLQKLFTRLARN